MILYIIFLTMSSFACQFGSYIEPPSGLPNPEQPEPIVNVPPLTGQTFSNRGFEISGFPISIGPAFFSYGQSSGGISATVPQQAAILAQVDFEMPIADHFFIIPGIGFSTGGSYSNISGDIIDYSYAFLSLNLKRRDDEWAFGGGFNIPAWQMYPQPGNATIGGNLGYQAFCQYYLQSDWLLEFGYMTVNGEIHENGETIGQFVAGPYIKLSYE